MNARLSSFTQEAGTHSPRVSIITISKDDPVGLANTLRSVASQTYEDFEHILVLAGRSRELTLPNDYQLRVLSDAEPGISNALNAGLLAARGEWVQFLNGGDRFVNPESLQSMISQAITQVDMVCAFAKVLQRSFTIPRQQLMPGYDQFIYASHQASLFRRCLFEKYGLFNTKIYIHMDLEWLTRLPEELPYAFLDVETVYFDPHGVSSTKVVVSSIEEAKILWGSRRYMHKALIVIFLKLPFRVFRREYRRWFQ
jgi:glycosyltransferase involved in cell wall biosynthesis